MKRKFNIQHSTSNFRCARSRNSIGRSMFDVRRWLFPILFCACLDEGFVSRLSAGEPLAASPAALASTSASDSDGTNSNQLVSAPVEHLTPRTFGESDLQELLTTTLQQDYVRDKGQLEL